LPITEASDGVKAFTGMITEMIAGDPLVLLIIYLLIKSPISIGFCDNDKLIE
jgi:hypothetical protein